MILAHASKPGISRTRCSERSIYIQLDNIYSAAAGPFRRSMSRAGIHVNNHSCLGDRLESAFKTFALVAANRDGPESDLGSLPYLPS